MKFSLKIIRKRWLSSKIFSLEFYLPGINPQPGQFFQIQVSENLHPFLNRPNSVASYEKNRLMMIIKVVGKGTGLLSEKCAGDKLTIFGPLGKGLRVKNKKSLLIAGGIGVAPLYFLAQTMYNNSVKFDFIYGARVPEELILKQNI